MSIQGSFRTVTYQTALIKNHLSTRFVLHADNIIFLPAYILNHRAIGGYRMDNNGYIRKLETTPFIVQGTPKENEAIAESKPDDEGRKDSNAAPALGLVRRRRRATAVLPNSTKTEERDDGGMRTLVMRLIVCAAVCLCMLLLKNIDSPFAKSVTDGVKTAITFDLSIDDSLGKLKFVQNTNAESQEVMAAAGTNMLLPVEGIVTTAFKEGFSDSVTIMATENTQVVAAEDGLVQSVESVDELCTVTLQHDGQLSSRYSFDGIPEVAEGDTLLQGESIAQLASGQQARFSVLRQGVAVDPSVYLGTSFHATDDESQETMNQTDTK